MSLERNLLPAPGPRFSRAEDGQLMFSFVIDSSSVIGPRPATKRDQFEHSGAYRVFMATQMDEALQTADTPPTEAELAIPEAADFNGADPTAFDHDGDGQAGGAPKGGNRRRAKAP